MDALESFTHLTDNLPSWLTKLEELSAQVAEQHARFSELTTATEIKLTRRKTDSTESLRTQKERENTPGPQADAGAQADATSEPPSTSNFPSSLQNKANDVLAIKEARRKRKPGSALSAASGPQKYRTRSMVIVYYDSEIQEAFELLVRKIASARNNLRKGKAAASFKARMASLDMGSPLLSAGGERDLDSKLGLPMKKSVPSAVKDPPAFDTVDKDLESSQMACERAAHQILRDGNCKEELLRTKNNFQNSLRLAQAEVERLREEEAQEAAKSPAMEEPIFIEVEEKVTPPTIKPTEFAGVEAIEVDDISEVEVVQIDLSAIRRTRRV